MRILSIILAALAVILLPVTLATVAFAQDATQPSIEVGAFLGELLPLLREVLSLVLLAILGWLAMWIKRKFGLDIEETHRKALHSAILTGIGRAASRYGSGLTNIRVDVDSPLVADAVNYVLRSVPDAVKKLGATPEFLAEMVVGRLADTPATAPVPPVQAPGNA